MAPGELAPSVIAADFRHLEAELARVEPYSSRWHVDVMDGHYVPNLTIGPMLVEAIAAASDLPQDVHLMVRNPAETWEWYARAGARRIAFHPETAPDPLGLVKTLREAGIGPGVALNPDVDAEEADRFVGHVDHILVMSVYPGFSGQAFLPEILPKLRTLRSRVDNSGERIQLIVDGGVNLQTAPACVEAGADVLVSASAVFKAPDPASVASRLRASWPDAPAASGT